MRSRRTSRVLIVAFLLIIFSSVALWLALAKTRVSSQVQQIVSELGTPDAQDKLIAFGPQAYGELRRILLYQSDTYYARLWTRLPSPIRDRLPDPGTSAELRDNLQQHLKDAGPVICRAMTGAVCTALESGDLAVNKMALLPTLVWSIPESTRATTTLSNLLAHSTNNSLFGYVYGGELWSKVSHLAPLLAQRLRNKDTLNEAANALAHMGTNAAFAVPVLIEIAETGPVSPPIRPARDVPYTPDFDPVATRRIIAIHALGRIGVTNAAVMHALNKAAESGNDKLCSAAYLAALQLELPITGPLQAWADQ